MRIYRRYDCGISILTHKLPIDPACKALVVSVHDRASHMPEMSRFPSNVLPPPLNYTGVPQSATATVLLIMPYKAQVISGYGYDSERVRSCRNGFIHLFTLRETRFLPLNWNRGQSRQAEYTLPGDNLINRAS